jgi:hypothetical protein
MFRDATLEQMGHGGIVEAIPFAAVSAVRRPSHCAADGVGSRCRLPARLRTAVF